MRAATVTLLIGAVLLGPAAGLAQATLPAYDPRSAFTETDRNGDGAVDHEEFIDRITEVFFIADKDKDGRLSVAEVEVALVRTENVDAADSDDDGAISLHEFRRARLTDFDAADADDSGTLSVTEVVDAYAGKRR
jgi:Ca2+-binding EF-hand superfamily protein